MPVQRQGNHQPHHLLSRQAPMTDTGCLSAFDRLFNPLNRQMLAQPAPVWRFEMVGEEMQGVVEHGRRRLTAVQTVYNRPMKKCRSVLTERHYGEAGHFSGNATPIQIIVRLVEWPRGVQQGGVALAACPRA